jgi:hypothetical protein
VVYNSIIEALSKLGGIKDWISIHVKVEMSGDRRHELYFSNPDYIVPVEKEEIKPAKPSKPPETLYEKIKRMRFAELKDLSEGEQKWFKERQKELEYKKIGQIQPDDSMEVALEKLKKIGVDK